MREEISASLNDPELLESLYRKDKKAFKIAFNSLYSKLQGDPIAQVWYQRLNFEQNDHFLISKKDLFFIFSASILAFLLAKTPEFTKISEDFFYPRNIAFVVFPFLTFYFLWRDKASKKLLLISAIASLVAIVFINILPNSENSDTLILACIHLPFFMWTILGYAFARDHWKESEKRLEFLSYLGDMVVMSVLILIAGGILTGITIGLFSLIELDIVEFYMEYIATWGLCATPLLATYLVQNNPQLVNKVSPIIAKVFTPLVLITLVAYLIAVIWTGKDPYNDREFLLVFNVLLICVMAIILFSIAENTKHVISKIGLLLLLALSVVTILVNSVALSAILFRITEWGLTPNRLAVLGGNLLILINLLLVTRCLYVVFKGKAEIESVSESIVRYLPIYSLWTMVITFLFPLIFWFK